MKYIFIDSNQYRHIYSSSEGFSQEIYDLLIGLIDRQHVHLLLPQQTKDEVERNRMRAWPESDESDIARKIEKLKERIEKVKGDFGHYSGGKTLLKNLALELRGLEKDKKDIVKKYTKLSSEQNQKISELFSRAQLIQESNEIYQSATRRLAKGNPPYSKDKKIGDSLIWESILSHLGGRRSEKPRLIFVSNDKVAWGDGDFDSWLSEEFKMVTRGRVIYSNRLSSIPDLTAEEQERIRIEEEQNLKKNAVSDFVNSHSFVNAGSNANRLLRYKTLYTADDYLKIVTAAVSNHEIYQSFFTSGPLNALLEGDGGYVVMHAESIPSDIWERFEKRYKTGLKRQSDQNESDPEEAEFNPDDIPF